MRQSPQISGQLSVVDQTDVGQRVSAFLRTAHPFKTADHVAARSRIPAGTVQKWLDRGSAPSAAHMLRLVDAYGPDFLCAAFDAAPEWVSSAARERQSKTVKAEIARLQAKLEARS